jgi:hypothetical protein
MTLPATVPWLEEKEKEKTDPVLHKKRKKSMLVLERMNK